MNRSAWCDVLVKMKYIVHRINCTWALPVMKSHNIWYEEKSQHSVEDKGPKVVIITGQLIVMRILF